MLAALKELVKVNESGRDQADIFFKKEPMLRKSEHHTTPTLPPKNTKMHEIRMQIFGPNTKHTWPNLRLAGTKQ